MKRKILSILLISLGVTTYAQLEKSTIDLKEVVVSASRSITQLKNIPQKIEVITKEEIQGIPADNVAEILKRTANLDIIQYPGLSATIGLRGFSPNTLGNSSYVLILINGKPSGTQNLASIDMNMVEKIELVKGPYASLYGSQAMGGVVNIITKIPSEKASGSFSYSFGSFGNSTLSASASMAINDKINVRLGYNSKQQSKDYRIGSKNLLKLTEKEKLILDKNSFGDAMLHSTWELNNLNAIIDYKINNYWKANAEIIYASAHNVETPGDYWGNYGYTKKDISRLNAYGNFQRRSDNNFLQLSTFYTTESNPNYSDISDTSFIDFKSIVSEYGLMLHDNYTSGNFVFTGGTDYKLSDYKSERQSEKGVYAKPYRPNNNVENSAIFFQIAYNKNAFSANAGIRYDHYKFHTDKNDSIQSPGADETYNTINPSLGIQYRFRDNFRVHTSAGTAFLVPDAYKVAGNYKGWFTYVGNPELKPERSTTYDIGLSFSNAKSGVDFDLTYFNTFYKDKIISTMLETGEQTYENAQEANMDGIEISSSYDFGALASNKFKLKFYANYTFMINSMYQETVESSVESDSILNKAIQYVRKTNGNFGLMYNNKAGFELRINGRYIGSRFEKDWLPSIRPDIITDYYYTNDDYLSSDKILQHPDFLLFDFSSSFTFKNNISIGVLVSNIFDDNYTEKDGFNMPGRKISGKIQFKF